MTRHCSCIALALLLAAPAWLAGCAPKQAVPTFLAADVDPVLPGECFAPRVKEPRLPEDHDSSDLDATRDREALKKALRYEAAKRRTCGERLRTLFPKGSPS